MLLETEVLNLVITSVVGFVTTGTLVFLVTFVKEQRKVNKANALANRSMQRAELYRYFRIVVEQGMPVTPEEHDHIKRCYDAYHENDGNGTGTLMFNRIEEHVKINTGIAN